LIVYWIHEPRQTDPHSEGYIGITSQPIDKRFKDHRYNNKNIHLKHRCRSENVTCEVLHDHLSETDAKRIEWEYRPIERIGWNIAAGGDIPPSRRGKTSPASYLRGDQRTRAQKLGAAKASLSKRGKPSKKKGRIYTPPKICFYCKKEFRSHLNKAKFCTIKCMGLNMIGCASRRKPRGTH